MRFIPEYAPVRKLTLSFVDAFYNTRFHYGRAQAQIIRACRGTAVEMHLDPGEMDAFRAAVGEAVLQEPHLSFKYKSPGTAIMLEAAPIFAEEEHSQKENERETSRLGLVFYSPRLEDPEGVHAFSRELAESNGFMSLELGFNFATAELLVNEDVVLLSSEQFKSGEDERKLHYFQMNFPGYDFHIVPCLSGDITGDLDMYLWPIAPKVWIASRYPDGSAQEESIKPALAVLASHDHTVHRVPGLEPLIYDDINTVPNYANGVILNRLALVPAYGRKEDSVVVDILRGYGFRVEQIDCADIILSNSGIHCISTAIPA